MSTLAFGWCGHRRLPDGTSRAARWLRCTIHWEDQEAMVERFSYSIVTQRFFEVNRDRFTCSGGVAPLDLMTYLLTLELLRRRSVAPRHARQRLLHSLEPVADIALQSGFVNRSHFARSFRLEFGITPSELRAQQGLAQ